MQLEEEEEEGDDEKCWRNQNLSTILHACM